MNRKYFAVIVLICILVIGHVAMAYDSTVVAKVKKTCNEAVAFLDKGGKLNTLSEKSNKFIDGTIYPFVYKCEGTNPILIAHPFLPPTMFNTSISTIHDKNGKFFTINICIQSKKHPEGTWDNYFWMNPTTKIIEEKFSYFKPLPSNPNIVVIVGMYKSELGEDITLDKLKSEK